MPSLDRRTRERLALHDKILDAARDLFVREGYEAVSMRRIAEAIEYTAPTIYTHFKDKAELLRTLCRKDFGALSEGLVALNQIEDPVRRIVALGHAYIRFAVEHPHHYRFMFMTPLPPEVEPEAEDLAAMQDPNIDGYAALCHACSQAIARGMIREEHSDPELVAQAMWAAVHGVASLQITHAQDPCVKLRPAHELAHAIVTSMMLGMLNTQGIVSLATGAGAPGGVGSAGGVPA
jgi:AcrR family transcriptional regulator